MSKKSPFFLRFVESQPTRVETDVKAGGDKVNGKGWQTMKAPSDDDEYAQTMKWPSDGDEGLKD